MRVMSGTMVMLSPLVKRSSTTTLGAKLTVGLPLPETVGLPLPETVGLPLPKTVGLPLPETDGDMSVETHGDMLVARRRLAGRLTTDMCGRTLLDGVLMAARRGTNCILGKPTLVRLTIEMVSQTAKRARILRIATALIVL